MQIDTVKIERIIHSELPTQEIEAVTGMTRQNVNKYRRGESDIHRMTIENAGKFCTYYEHLVIQGIFPPTTKDSDKLDYVLKFDDLPMDIKCLLVIRNFDSRGFSNGLEGLHLRFNQDAAFNYVQIHSGVGGGHPVYEFVQNTAYVIPLRSYVSERAGSIIQPVPFESNAIPKYELYNNYLNDTENLKLSASRIERYPYLTKTSFDMQYGRIDPNK